MRLKFSIRLLLVNPAHITSYGAIDSGKSCLRGGIYVVLGVETLIRIVICLLLIHCAVCPWVDSEEGYQQVERAGGVEILKTWDHV